MEQAVHEEPFQFAVQGPAVFYRLSLSLVEVYDDVPKRLRSACVRLSPLCGTGCLGEGKNISGFVYAAIEEVQSLHLEIIDEQDTDLAGGEDRKQR